MCRYFWGGAWRTRRGIRWRCEGIDGERGKVALVARVEYNEVVFRETGDGTAVGVTDDDF